MSSKVMSAAEPEAGLRKKKAPGQIPPLPLAGSTQIGCREFSLKTLPDGVEVKEELGLAAAAAVTGRVVHRAATSLFEARAVVTPGGDYLLMFPEGGHYSGNEVEGKYHKVNEMIAYRSRDRGRSWEGPSVAFDIDYNQHGFIPFIPRGSRRIYAFGTQPIWGRYNRADGLQENAPIGYRYSDDDGHTWSDVTLIAPVNDPAFTGMSVMRMCETDAGTWLLGSHEGDWSYRPLMTRQYLLRSEDRGVTWELLPGKRHGGWYAREFNRMDEGRPISLGDGRALLMTRTPSGRLWAAWSEDDGRSWTCPAPTSLVHPDAPPMLFHLSDGRTLAAFHHNRHHDLDYNGLSAKEEIMKDRSEIWVSLSTDGGRKWSEPRFVFANAALPDLANPFKNYQCSYLDMFMDGDTVNLIVPHRWQQVLHLTLREEELRRLPTRSELGLD